VSVDDDPCPYRVASRNKPRHEIAESSLIALSFEPLMGKESVDEIDLAPELPGHSSVVL
jgi:hypothetical protein